MANPSRPPRVSVANLPRKAEGVSPVDDYPCVLPADLMQLPCVLPADAGTRGVEVAELPVVLPAEEARRRFWLFALIGAVWFGMRSACEWLFGVATLILGLSILASIPVVQFLSLGYLLEASARVARQGRLRDGFPGVRKAARLGSIVLGTWLLLLPLGGVPTAFRLPAFDLIYSYRVSAQIIDPGGPAARGWAIAHGILTLLAAAQIVMACARGGKLRYFFWPFNWVWLGLRIWRGGFYAASRDAVWDFAMGLRLPYYFWLGARGFAGAFAWLALPISLIAVGRFFAPYGYLGAFLLMAVLMYLPFLQVQFACENRFAAHFDLRAGRQAFRRAPWAFAFAFVLALLFAVPLYILKIEMVQRELAWLPGIVFITFIFPARLLTGWAYGRSRKRATPRHWFFRWTGRLSMIPVTVAFVIIVFFSQFLSWNGVWSLYEQHAFLLPVPFAGM